MADAIAPEVERDALKAAIVAFLRKWDAVLPAIDGAFTLAHIHGQRYDGPTLEEEIQALRGLVDAAPPPPKP